MDGYGDQDNDVNTFWMGPGGGSDNEDGYGAAIRIHPRRRDQQRLVRGIARGRWRAGHTRPFGATVFLTAMGIGMTTSLLPSKDGGGPGNDFGDGRGNF